MDAMTLDEKIEAAESVLTGLLAEADGADIRVAWTGGKDSSVVLFLWKAVVEHAGQGPARAISLDTGCKFPEVIAFRDQMTREWGVDLHVARPEVPLEGYPLAKDKLACCRDLKIAPLKRAVRETGTRFLLSGIRRDEHPDREGRALFEERDDPAHAMVNPILDWTEMDIWAFHARFGLAHCSLYDEGYRSLGCVPCTEKTSETGSERSGRAQEKETVLQTLTDLGYF